MSWIRPSFRWFAKAKQPGTSRAGRWFRPCLERLEDRLAPATFTVSTLSDSGTGSLRQAILDANAATGATNTIDFALSGSGLQTIVPLTPLPTITNPVVLDGYTQSGASANTLTTGDNAVLTVELDGSSAGSTASGLTLAAADSIIRGLVIDDFGGAGITLTGAAANHDTIAGNFIGTDTGGASARANGTGILLAGGAANNVLGGTDTAARNVISGNTGTGVLIVGSGTTGNTVEGDYIGTTASGAAKLGNGYGVDVISANNTVGGATTTPGTGAGNVISGNAQNGVDITGSGATGNLVAGNLIGTDVTGTRVLSGFNETVGVMIENDAANNTVGGSTPTPGTGLGNVISGSEDGVVFFSGASGNLAAGNLIGTDITGQAALGNYVGVDVSSDATNNTVGGSTPTPGTGLGNVISGNVVAGIELVGPDNSGNVVAGNLIGTNPSGRAALANDDYGIIIGAGATNNTIGGSTTTPGTGLGNVIAGNGQDGVVLTNSGTSGNVLAGNLIGTDRSGTVGLGNPTDGVLIENGATNNTVGGATPTPGTGLGNVISANGYGVDVEGSSTTENVIAGNLIGTDVSGTRPLGNTLGVFLSTGASGNTVGGATAAAGTGLGNVISANGQRGVYIHGSGASNNEVAGNLIGTDVTGAVALGNRLDGVFIDAGASDNTVGGATLHPGTGLGNVISGNVEYGVNIDGSGSDGNEVAGNLIGTDSSGRLALANGLGIVIADNAADNTVGGTTQAAGTGPGNVISGNTSAGVDILFHATGNVVAGNLIGTDRSGTVSVGGGGEGVALGAGASDNTVGGTTARPGSGAGNVISGNSLDGVVLFGGATENDVEGNLIGTNPSGTRALGNGLDGVRIESGAVNNTIGGATAAPGTGAGNVISGNDQQGVHLLNADTSGNVVAGNLIGTDVSGRAALGNGLDGVLLESVSDIVNDVVVFGGPTDNTIGGTTPTPGTGLGNVISGNREDGVHLQGGDTSSNVVAGNLIGTDASGARALGNRIHGVLVEAGASDNTLGGTTTTPGTGVGNVISGNAQFGVLVQNSGTSDNLIAGNLIGTDASGARPLGNAQGVGIANGAALNDIGGTGAGNVISGNHSSGVVLSVTAGDVVADNLIGTDVSGSRALGNAGDGVIIGGAVENIIGGDGAGNLISGNGLDGIQLTGGATTYNLIAGNRIGTDLSGRLALANGLDGVGIESGASENFIGGATVAAGTGLGNVISGNNQYGVDLGGISGSDVTDNVVSGNLIGTNASGTAALGNGGAGVEIRDGASNNTVGGATPFPGTGSGNVISGNRGYGVDVFGSGTSGNVVAGNLIGTDASGTHALGNRDIGVYLSNGAADNTVGGVTTSPGTGLGNVISSDRLGVVLVSSGTTGNVVAGNLIGTDASGTRALGNTQDGVSIGPGASDNTVGGTPPGPGSDPGNVISGNAQNGVSLIGAGTTANVVAGNRIGTDVTGTVAVGNHLDGVLVESGASDNTVGGAAAGSANTIAFNTANGVEIASGIGNTISTNVIFANAGLGIDLGISANDGQNYPVIQAEDDGTLAGVLSSVPDTAFRLEFFGNTSRGPSSSGQGEVYLGSLAVTTDDSGQVPFQFSFTPVAGKPFLTATATNLATQDTSEFSSSFVTPSVSVPPAQTVNEDAPLVLAGANAIVIADPSNDGSQAEQVTLAVEQGTLTLAGTDSLTFLAGGNGTASMTFQGTPATVNYALNGLQYLATDFNGTDMLTVSGSNPSAGSGTTTKQVAVTVNFVNDQPSFTAGDPPAVVENSGAQAVQGFVTGFDPGPGANEAGQTVLAYTVGNVSNPSLFAVLPAVDPSGTLTYTLAPNVTGTSTFSVQVQDSGGTANGGIDTSVPESFTLVVQPMPAPPPPPAQPTPPPPASPPATASAPPSAPPAPAEPVPAPPASQPSGATSTPSTSTTPPTAATAAADAGTPTPPPTAAALAAPGTAPARSGAASGQATEQTHQQAPEETSAAAVVPVSGPSVFGSVLDTNVQSGPQDGGDRGTVVTVVSLVETAQSRMANGAASIRPGSEGANEAQEVFVAKATHVASALLDGDDSIHLMEALLRGDQHPAPSPGQPPGLSRRSADGVGQAFQADASPKSQAGKPDLRHSPTWWPSVVVWIVPPAAFAVFWVRRRWRRRRKAVCLPLAANATPEARKRSA